MKDIMNTRKRTVSVRVSRALVFMAGLVVLVPGLFVPSAGARDDQQVRDMTPGAGGWHETQALPLLKWLQENPIRFSGAAPSPKGESSPGGNASPNTDRPPHDSYQQMVEAIGVEGIQNNADLIDFGMWINSLPGLGGSGYLTQAHYHETRTVTLLWNGPSDVLDRIIAEGEDCGITVVVIPVDYTQDGIDQVRKDLEGRSFDTPQGVWEVVGVYDPSVFDPQIEVSGYFADREEKLTEESREVIEVAASEIAAAGAPGVPVEVTDHGPGVVLSALGI